MEELKKLLVISADASVEEIQNRFTLLANKLFNEYEIVKGSNHYDFLEIEFYFFNKHHEDVTAFKRNLSAGKWHPHISGVDICFESDSEHYGGVFIRSIVKNDGISINGPHHVLFELFDNIDIDGDSSNLPVIREKYRFNNIIPKAVIRYNRYIGDFKDCKYRFYNDSKNIKWDPDYSVIEH